LSLRLPAAAAKARGIRSINSLRAAAAVANCTSTTTTSPTRRHFHSTTSTCMEVEPYYPKEGPGEDVKQGHLRPWRDRPAPDARLPDDTPRTYTSDKLTADAAQHKRGLLDPSVPPWQNPLHHYNPVLKVFREDFDSEEEFQAAQVPLPPHDNADESWNAPAYLHEMADEIVQLTLLETNELNNKLADHYGFHAGMLSPDDAAVADTLDDDQETASETQEQVKKTFDIRLVEFDAKAKIKVIKEVRSIAGLGLKEAKELVESAPKVFLKDVKREQAEEIKAKLEELGATIEIV
jgi:large subunit ribosomal protein L7/L12